MKDPTRSSEKLRLKEPSGWFAAGASFRRALTLLSDGAPRSRDPTAQRTQMNPMYAFDADKPRDPRDVFKDCVITGKTLESVSQNASILKNTKNQSGDFDEPSSRKVLHELCRSCPSINWADSVNPSRTQFDWRSTRFCQV